MSLEQYWHNEPLQRVVAVIPIATLSAFIYYMSSIPANELPDFTQSVSDKLLHVAAFFVYGLSSQFAVLGNFRTWSNNKIRVIALLIGASYGLLDEVHQMVVPGRNSTYTDWIADVLGLLLALMFTRWLRNIFRSKETV